MPFGALINCSVLLLWYTMIFLIEHALNISHLGNESDGFVVVNASTTSVVNSDSSVALNVKQRPDGESSPEASSEQVMHLMCLMPL
jgi:hypothetical protein